MAVYDVHPSVAMVQRLLAGLPEKTGHSLETWVRLVENQNLPDVKARTAWLKSAHGLGTNYAGWLAAYASGDHSDTGDPAQYLRNASQWIDAMYSGPKAALLPVHEALVELVRSLGPDVRVCPARTIVPIYRRHVMAQIKPTTLTRIDLGLSLGDTPAEGKLIDTGGFAKKDRITHRIPISGLADIDEEVRRWVRFAYDRDDED